MRDQRLEDLRKQLIDLGYLDRGVDRWFSGDAISDRTALREIATIASKAALLLAAPFALVPAAAMVIRNRPMSWDAAGFLAATYVASGALFIAAVFLLALIVVRIRPRAVVDRRGAHLAFAGAIGAALVVPVLWWWTGFGAAATVPETIAVSVLTALLFAAATRIGFAAVLSFAVHESRIAPTARRREARAAAAATMLAVAALAAVLAAAGGRRTPAAGSPLQVPVSPSDAAVVLAAVDGLSIEVFRADQNLSTLLPYVQTLPAAKFESPAAAWATIGTGTAPAVHRVRSVAGAEIVRGEVLQDISSRDYALDAAAAFRLARRVPLPPSSRERSYVWEILASRGVPVTAVNWWASVGVAGGVARVVPPEAVYVAARAQSEPAAAATAIDASVEAELAGAIGQRSSRFITGYFPALDIVTHRIEAPSTVVARTTIETAARLVRLTTVARRERYAVVLAGYDGSNGSLFIASSAPLRNASSHFDLVPTILDLFGFPASREMPGRSVARAGVQERIPTYGRRGGDQRETVAGDEYYRQLKALGYVQ